jgi:DNA-binding NtrC family response regulator
MAKDNYYHIQVVDDDNKVLTVIKHYSEKNSDYNVEVSTYESAETFLKNLSVNPDIVVLDYYFESEDDNEPTGLEILQKITKQSPETDTIMISGQDDIEVAMETIREGAYDYVVKNDQAIQRTHAICENILKAKNRELVLKENNKNLRTVVTILIIFIIFLAGFIGYALFYQ